MSYDFVVSFGLADKTVLDALHAKFHGDETQMKPISKQTATLEITGLKYRVRGIPSGTCTHKKTAAFPFGFSVDGKVHIPNDRDGHSIVQEYITTNFRKANVKEKISIKVKMFVLEKFHLDYGGFQRGEMKDWLASYTNVKAEQKENRTLKAAKPKQKEHAPVPLLTKTNSKDNDASATSTIIDAGVEPPSMSTTVLQAKLRASEKKLRDTEKKLGRVENELTEQKALLKKLAGEYKKATRENKERKAGDALSRPGDNKKNKRNWEEEQEGENGTGKNGDSERDDDEKIRDDIRQTKVTDCGVHWDDVVGLSDVKLTLKAMAIGRLTQPQMFTTTFKGILLYGPPGTGKTFMAQAVATESNSDFFSITSSDIMSKWHGDSERAIRMAFEMARECPNGAVMFFDEIDALCSARSNEDSGCERRVKNMFLLQMDGLSANKNGNVLVLGATNIPWELDDAFLRRFEEKVYIPLPDKSSRTILFRLKLKEKSHSLTDDNFEWLGENTNGVSGSDIQALVKAACVALQKRAMEAKQFLVDSEGFYQHCEIHPNCSACPIETGAKCSTCEAVNMELHDLPPGKGRCPPVTFEHLKAIMQKATLSRLSAEKMRRFEEWTEQLGLSPGEGENGTGKNGDSECDDDETRAGSVWQKTSVRKMVEQS